MMKYILAIFLLIGEASASFISSHVQVGDPASESAADLRVRGTAPVEIMDTRMVLLEGRHTTRRLTGKGTMVAMRLAAPGAAERVMVEIQEIHDRRPESFGYSVWINDQEVYFRTYEETGSGPNHFFVEFDRALLDRRGSFVLTLRNEADAPFNVSQIWVYPDFRGLVEEEQVYRKMGFRISASPHLAGMEGGKDADHHAIAREVAKRYGGLESYDLGFFTTIIYARRTFEDMMNQIDRRLEISTDLGIPYDFMFSSWWGLANVGPDGRGGYFSDLLYEAIRYDAATDSLRPSFPNQWGNSLWPTMNDEHLNLVNNHRIGVLARYLADRRAGLQATGRPVPAAAIYAEHGPSFGMDFNPAAVEAAGRDGVVMDPRTGDIREMGLWAQRNYARYFEQQVPTYRASLGRGAILVDKGTVTPPADPYLDNLYTHGFWGMGYPLHDPKHAHWQANFNDGMWNSGELTEAYPQSWYDYVVASARLSCVNLERVMIKNYRYLPFAYGNGLEFVTIFNTVAGDEKLVHEYDGISDQLKPTQTYDRRVLDVVYARDKEIGQTAGLLRHEGLEIVERQVQPLVAGGHGSMRYLITDTETSFAEGLRLEVFGSAGRRNQQGFYIRVLAGDPGSARQEIKVLRAQDFNSPDTWGSQDFATVDLSSVARGRSEIEVELELHTGGQPPEVHVKQLHALIPWHKPSGATDGRLPTLRESRERNLWLQWRVRLGRALRDYAALGGREEILNEARRLKSEGRYVSAWRLLTEHMAAILPARYAVRGHGMLHPWPVGIRCAKDDAVVQVELLAVSDEAVEFIVQAKDEQPFTLQVAGLAPHRPFVHEALGEGRHRIVVADGSANAKISNQRGEWSAELIALAPVPPSEFPFEPVPVVDLPRTGRGRVEVEAGIIKSFEPPSIEGEFSNGIVELESGNRYELGYTPWWTKCDMVGLTQLKSAGLDVIAGAFKPGSPVVIEYEPRTFEGRLPRIQQVTQPVKTLFHKDYTKMKKDTWSEDVVAVEGLQVADLRGMKLFPVKAWQPGHVVYRIEHDQPLGETALAFTGRFIMRPQNWVKFFVRPDSKADWVFCGEYDTASPGSNNFGAMKFVDLTKQVQGLQAFDLKVEIHTMNSTWASLGSLQVRTIDFGDSNQ
jgi:hypothetical protein